MANTASIQIVGIDSIIRALNALPIDLRNSAETAVLRAGGNPILKAAKANAAKSKDSGLLVKSIGLSVRAVNGRKTVRVGPRTGLRQVVTRTDKRTGRKYEEIADPNNYSHLVEYGTSHSAAKPFIRPAIDATQGEVLDAMAAGLDQHLTKVAARLSKKR